ncbi:hypothetical protein HAZT_HAZT009293 [Hyalella azteca]|uniref:Uncharacterized protein n=1 Tax=Hyalella azteca TaxID=294128 RepID=A0A6A0HDQ1_HYAAZ|nr:hypothetical protein HAZT_HAZT009293 [Hyalella azteca]
MPYLLSLMSPRMSSEAWGGGEARRYSIPHSSVLDHRHSRHQLPFWDIIMSFDPQAPSCLRSLKPFLPPELPQALFSALNPGMRHPATMTEDLHAWSIYRQNLNTDFTDSALGSSDKTPLPYGNFLLKEATVQAILNNPRYAPKSELGSNMYTYLKFGLPRVFPPNEGREASSGYDSSDDGGHRRGGRGSLGRADRYTRSKSNPDLLHARDWSSPLPPHIHSPIRRPKVCCPPLPSTHPLPHQETQGLLSSSSLHTSTPPSGDPRFVVLLFPPHIHSPIRRPKVCCPPLPSTHPLPHQETQGLLSSSSPNTSTPPSGDPRFVVLTPHIHTPIRRPKICCLLSSPPRPHLRQ